MPTLPSSLLHPQSSPLLPPPTFLRPTPLSLLATPLSCLHLPRPLSPLNPQFIQPTSSSLLHPPSTHTIYIQTDQMRKKQIPQISLQLIEQERLAIARRTEHRIAAMHREEENRHKSGAYFYVLLTFCVFVLVLYSYLTFSKKCSCTCTM